MESPGGASICVGNEAVEGLKIRTRDGELTEYASGHGYQRSASATNQRATPGRGAEVGGDHLLIMHLLYVRTTYAGPGSASRQGYASLDSLRGVSGLPAWRLWELIEDLQELDLVSCVWDSRASKAPASRQLSGESSDDLRFLRSTLAGLTAEGRSYPPLLEYHRMRDRGRWDTAGPAPGRTRRRQSLPRRPRYPGGKLRWTHRPARGYHLYRPQAQAVRRLAYLACLLFAILLATTVYVALALT